MCQNINLRDGEIAVVIGNASIIMNVNTAFEVGIMEKILGSCDCTKTEEQEVHDIDKNINEPKTVTDCNTTETTHNKEPFYSYSFANVSEVKSVSNVGGKEKIPVLAFEFDTERAAHFNDLREGVGKCIKNFDSMASVDRYFGVTPGTTSAVVNTWLPYIHYSGVMNPMNGNQKNYRFSSKHGYKTLRWKFSPAFNNNGIGQVVVFRADAVPDFIIERYMNNTSLNL